MPARRLLPCAGGNGKQSITSGQQRIMHAAPTMTRSGGMPAKIKDEVQSQRRDGGDDKLVASARAAPAHMQGCNTPAMLSHGTRAHHHLVPYRQAWGCGKLAGCCVACQVPLPEACLDHRAARPPTLSAQHCCRGTAMHVPQQRAVLEAAHDASPPACW